MHNSTAAVDLPLLRSRSSAAVLSRRLFFAVATGLLVLCMSAQAQDMGTVSGTVTDAKTRSAMPGVNVIVLGTQYGTSTNTDGHYRLRLRPGTYELQVSFVGYNRVREKFSA